MRKTAEELDKAHTLLLVALEVGAFPPGGEARARDALSVICWALGHSHESTFTDLIVKLASHIHIIDTPDAIAEPAAAEVVH